MKIMIKQLLLIVFALGYILGASAQQNPILGVGKVKQDAIQQRWSISNPSLFLELSKVGVHIDRLVLDENDKAQGNWQRVNSTTVKAKDKEDFGKGEFARDTAMIAVAQMLYGKSDVPKELSLIERAQLQQIERENKQLMISILASVNPKIAEAAGLYFEDRMLVNKKHKYVYRIFPADTIDYIEPIDTGYVMVSGRDLDFQRKLGGLNTTNNEQNVVLKWPQTDYNFVGYFIERSEDAKNFKALNSKIYLAAVDTTSILREFTYMDSVENYKPYYYRVFGVDAFGERKMFADTVVGMGIDLTPPQVDLLTNEQIDRKVKFSWDKPHDEDLKGYYLVYGDEVGNIKKLAVDKMFKPDETKIEYQLPDSLVNGFYRIMAIDNHNNYSFSNPSYVFVVDTIPPKAPEGLLGRIDSLGQVNISWQSIPEEDHLKGFKVFFANNQKSEYVAISGLVLDTAYTFQVPLNTLTQAVYIKVLAVDGNFNHGDFSQVLKISLPDTIPPVAPVLLSLKQNGNHLDLAWHSASSDVASYTVYRKLYADADWTELNKVDTLTYTDKDVEGSKLYEYALVAVDSSGNRSAFSFPKVIKTDQPKLADIGLISSVKGKDIELYWTKPTISFTKYIVYKDQGRGLEMYKQVDKSQDRFLDGYNPAKSYAIKIIFEDGSESELYQLKN